ncbi:MAG: 5' nucleotidase, NT5C type [Sphingobacteriales bacterium]
MKERVIIDMDEVMADTMGKMVGWYEAVYGVKVNYSVMRDGSWLVGFPEEHRTMIRERLHGPGFFRDVPLMDGSQEVLREMNERYEVFIVSAAMEFPNSLKDKLEWLLEHYPFLNWRQLVLCGDKRMINGDHMIDDHVRNLKHFSGKKYLYTSFHNVDVTEYVRVNDWTEIAEQFL